MANSIKSIETEKVPGEESLLYTITCENVEGLKYKFSFYYQPAGEIRFKNQDQILWTKKKK